jgi:excinuclease ABC subunit C
MTIQEKIASLPLKPGVYQFFDEKKDLLYVGKAKKLRLRVRSYFQDSKNHDRRIQVMISKIRHLEVIVTDTEAEALMLENTMIKTHQPRYNIMYRDDKSYPYICITNDDRPRVYPTRTPIQDGSRYLGPYDHVGHMKKTLDTLRQMFHLCTCAVSFKTVDKSRGAPKWRRCLDGYLGQCSVDLPQDEYVDSIRLIEKVLSGKTEQIRRELLESMEMASQALHFESAAKIRDSIQSLDVFSQKMKLVEEITVNRDLFALAISQEIDEACGVLFRIREGKLIGKFHRYMKNLGERPSSDIMQSFVEDYYTGQHAEIIPNEVMLSEPIEDPDPLLEYLSDQLGKKVKWLYPKIGDKKQLVNMALSNAEFQLKQRELEKLEADRDRTPKSLEDLKTYLSLSRLPRRMECFDNSNMQGSDPVASMVCFVDGKPRKSMYKKYAIKTVVGPDDFASMREILRRRYGRLKKEGAHFPDLIVVDGGKGQLSAAVEVLEELELMDAVDVIGLAKRLEEVFLPYKKDSILIPKTSPSLRILQQLRDEAHRFAITFHREKRSKRTLKSDLTTIPGIGETTSKKLLRTFGSVQSVRHASQTELQEAIGKKMGTRVYEVMQQKR